MEIKYHFSKSLLVGSIVEADEHPTTKYRTDDQDDNTEEINEPNILFQIIKRDESRLPPPQPKETRQ